VTFIKRVLRAIGLGILAVVLLFEEWGWEPLQRLMGQFARLPLWGAMERVITRLPRWGALMVFALPGLMLLPVKLLALYLFANGKAALGLVLLVGAKLLGTAVVARLFHLTLPALMQFALFATYYPRWKNWKDAFLAQIRQSPPWLRLMAFKAELKATVRAWWASVKP
jgi:hypothetical protein